MKTKIPVLWLGLLFLLVARAAHSQDATPATGDGGWPRVIPSGKATVYLYQPQIDTWSDNILRARSAVKVSGPGKGESYGVVWYKGQTEIQKDPRMVLVHNFVITKANFPGSPDRGQGAVKALQGFARNRGTLLSLDRLLTSLAAMGGKTSVPCVQVRNDPPRLIFSTTPAMLVPLHGEPSSRPVQDTKLRRVVNTPALLLHDPQAGRFYLYLTDRWLSAAQWQGPWEVATGEPAELAVALQAAKEDHSADLFLDPGPGLKKDLERGKLPTIYMSTVPTELIVTTGEPRFERVSGTKLQWCSNTETDLFLYPSTRQYYLLLSGRWFTSASLAGAWTYVPGTQLPFDFASIPVTSPRGSVRVSVPGTPEAQEAVIAAFIPQTATIDMRTAKLEVGYDGGAPNFQPITGTNKLSYAVNCAYPVIQVTPGSYFAVKAGVWFQAVDPAGPWQVATSVPRDIYAIPPSCPIFNVTYVKVYGSTPTEVYVGYTPGYYGTVVSPEATVVYGTGYDYPAYVGTEIVVAPPVTYGAGAGYLFGASTGYVLGTATSAYWGPGWGYGWGYPLAAAAVATAYWGGAYCSGPMGGAWAATSNVYGQWGNTVYRGMSTAYANPVTGNYGRATQGVGYNSRTGTYYAGQRVSNTNAYTGVSTTAGRGAAVNPNTGNVSAVRGGTVTNPNTGKTSGAVHGATYRPATGTTSTWGAAKVGNNVYAGHDGNVYKVGGGDSWQHWGGSGSGWQSAAKSPTFSSGTMSSEVQARTAGAARTDSFNRAGGGSGWGSFGGGTRSGSGGWGGVRGGGGRRR